MLVECTRRALLAGGVGVVPGDDFLAFHEDSALAQFTEEVGENGLQASGTAAVEAGQCDDARIVDGGLLPWPVAAHVGFCELADQPFGVVLTFSDSGDVVQSPVQCRIGDAQDFGKVVEESVALDGHDALLLELAVGLEGDFEGFSDVGGGQGRGPAHIGDSPLVLVGGAHQTGGGDAERLGQFGDALGVGHRAPVLVGDDLGLCGADTSGEFGRR